jgi:hypothetical protein
MFEFLFCPVHGLPAIVMAMLGISGGETSLLLLYLKIKGRQAYAFVSDVNFNYVLWWMGWPIWVAVARAVTIIMKYMGYPNHKYGQSYQFIRYITLGGKLPVNIRPCNQCGKMVDFDWPWCDHETMEESAFLNFPQSAISASALIVAADDIVGQTAVELGYKKQEKN